MNRDEIFREVPDVVHEAVLTALDSLEPEKVRIRKNKLQDCGQPAAAAQKAGRHRTAGFQKAVPSPGTSDQKSLRSRSGQHAFRFSRAAAVLLACFLAAGATVLAAEGIRLYRQRMEEMDAKEIETYYETALAGEATESNRPFTAEEQTRYDTLLPQYENNGLFPQAALACLDEGEPYGGEGVFLDPSARKLYLPDRALTDEELLEIMDFHHRVDYSIYQLNQAQILSGDGWESRMAQLSDERVSEIYLNMFDNPMPTSGSRSRPLTESEQSRYDALETQYEEEGLYIEPEIPIIHAPEEYAGTGVALCTADSTYYMPEAELTDEELLQIIDYDHKADYCISRIGQEVMLGLRKGYPNAEGTDTP